LLALSSLILGAMERYGVVTVHVYGEFGAGKTSYALWTCYYVLKSFSKCLDYLFFNPLEAVEVISSAVKTGERIPVIIMDDSGLWLNRSTWYERPKVAFTEFFNLIRSVASGVIFTSPGLELPSQLIRKIQYRVRIVPANPSKLLEIDPSTLNRVREVIAKHELREKINIALGYKVNLDPKFHVYVKHDFIDIYPMEYPKEVYDKYMEKRRMALNYYMEKWRNSLLEEA